jgi:hypothetical protein
LDGHIPNDDRFFRTTSPRQGVGVDLGTGREEVLEECCSFWAREKMQVHPEVYRGYLLERRNPSVKM